MRKIIILFIIILAGNFLFAQSPNIVAMEYYFDLDPGFGNGTPVTVVAGSTIDKTFSINVSGLSPGFHRLCIRTKDALGKWSLTSKQDIYKTDQSASVPEEPAQITAMEYFFDNDPGFGNATSVAISAGQVINNDFNAGLTSLTDGFHRFYVRVKDETGKWSLIHKQDIFISNESATNPEPLKEIVEMEYFIGSDPGFGNGEPVSVTPGDVINQSFSVDVGLFNYGSNNFYVRVKEDRRAHV